MALAKKDKTMKKFIFITLIIASSSLLFSKPKSLKKPAISNKNDSQKSINDLPPLKPLYKDEIPVITQTEQSRPEKRHVERNVVLQDKMAIEGKVILTFTYIGTGPEGYAILKDRYPDFFEKAKPLEQEQLSTQNSKQPHSIEPLPIKIPQWLLESSIDNAPALLKGIFTYLQSSQHNKNASHKIDLVPSFHRFILVGQPGTGKTTLAYAIAHMLNYPVVFIPATSLLGHFRNQTSNNIEKCLQEHTQNRLPKVIIIDELHKLFEHHTNSQSDDSQSAAAFWLALDKIEKENPNIIIIGTANDVTKLPPEIKSRFSGKIIKMPLLNNNQKIQTFINSITHDQSVTLDDSVTDEFITHMLQHIQNCSLRDVQLIIDSAKMFYYSGQDSVKTEVPIVLTRTHFQQALNQLHDEAEVLQENMTEKIYEKIKKWGVPLSVAVNVLIFIKESKFLIQYSHALLKTH